jgi:NADPH:quinone reductase-like Zn-dependent oxidoreductase
MAPATQKALFIDKLKGDWVLKTDHAVPTPGENQLLVKIESAALNPVDWKVRELGWFVEDYPALIGTDIAGVVEKAGPGVTKFKEGDRVFFQGSWSHTTAGFQEYTLAPVSQTARTPAFLTSDQVATIPVALAVAAIGFYGEKPKGAGLKEPWNNFAEKAYAGKATVILGGSSSVGQFAIQLAKLSGFSTIITTASPHHEAHLKSLGATHVIPRHHKHHDVIKTAEEIAGKPFEFVFDAISEKETQHLAHELTAKNGTTIVVLPAQIEKAADKDLHHALGIFGLPGNGPFGDRFYAALSGLVEQKLIEPNRVEVVGKGLNGIAPGLQQLKKISGVKLVIHPSETS